MVSEWEVPDMALKQARKAAHRAHKQCRGLIEYDDLVSIGYTWIAKHKDKVLEWSDKEQHPAGWKALGLSMLRYMNREIAKERAKRTGSSTQDAFYYTPGIIAEVLPDIWDADDRMPSQAGDKPDTRRGRSQPNEGMNREAVLADVSQAVSRLAVEERNLLQARFYSNLTVAEIARLYGISDDTVTRRVNNAIRTVNDLLGGESPWKRRRKSRSSAAAIAETRTQWDGGSE